MRIAKTLMTAVFAATIAAAAPAAAEKAKDAGGFSGKQKDEIRKLVRDYLIKNPEVIIEAMQEYRRRQREAQQRRTTAAIAENRKALLTDSTSPVGGNVKGDVTIVEFFDYRCGYCKAVHPQVKQVLADNPNVRIVYKEFPILGPASTFASRAAIASQRQGRKAYLKFHNALMAEREINPQSVMAVAKRVGLDMAKLTADMNRPEVGEIIRKNHELAQKLGIRGTPAFVIGNEMVPGAISAEQMSQKVEQARAQCKKEKAPIC